ncbi:hypothetical protein NUU61_008168 [Penicillium alfredii]|uniref:Uncharacterized protein n=1 Tax=Penicillium alfredii TaxID=1506179 RepID=A0A9W9ES53_9EURO|nr:uncharacterized protein NUU61_008168 [Penicillium alfredii]KAJ5086861.1 hypothetical protein NUU61_008168 [Penicillium alfredii]
MEKRNDPTRNLAGDTGTIASRTAISRFRPGQLFGATGLKSRDPKPQTSYAVAGKMTLKGGALRSYHDVGAILSLSTEHGAFGSPRRHLNPPEASLTRG